MSAGAKFTLQRQVKTVNSHKFSFVFLLLFFFSWGRTRTPESLSYGKDGFKWGETLPISQSGELPAACYDPVTAPGVSKPTKRVIVLLLQVDSVDRVGGGVAREKNETLCLRKQIKDQGILAGWKKGGKPSVAKNSLSVSLFPSWPVNK